MAFQTFIFLMILHPEAMKKAQAQIDDIVGDKQLPTLEDRPKLQYIDCIIKEVLRHVIPPCISRVAIKRTLTIALQI